MKRKNCIPFVCEACCKKHYTEDSSASDYIGGILFAFVVLSIIITCLLS